MPIALAGVLVGFGLIALALVQYGMHVGISGWLRPLVNALPSKQSWAGRILRATPAAVIVRGVGWVLHKVHHALSHALAFNLAPLVRWLTGLGSVVEAWYSASTRAFEDFAASILHLRHVTMPRVIHKIVAPTHALARHGAITADRSISLTHREATERRRAIDRIHWKWLVPLALAFGGIDAMRHRDLLRRERVDRRTLDRTVARERVLTRTTRAHARRLSRLEKLLGLGILTGLLVKVLARVAPWLFCRNWKKIGGRVCGLPGGLLNFLLGLGAAMFAFAELCRFVELVAFVAARVVPVLIGPLAVVGAALCGGKYDAAPPLPLRTTTLPTPANPLPLV